VTLNTHAPRAVAHSADCMARTVRDGSLRRSSRWSDRPGYEPSPPPRCARRDGRDRPCLAVDRPAPGGAPGGTPGRPHGRPPFVLRTGARHEGPPMSGRPHRRDLPLAPRSAPAAGTRIPDVGAIEAWWLMSSRAVIGSVIGSVVRTTIQCTVAPIRIRDGGPGHQSSTHSRPTIIEDRPRRHVSDRTIAASPPRLIWPAAPEPPDPQAFGVRQPVAAPSCATTQPVPARDQSCLDRSSRMVRWSREIVCR